MSFRLKSDFDATSVTNPVAAHAAPDPHWVRPVTPSTLPVSKTCRMVRYLVAEVLLLARHNLPAVRARRSLARHSRQIAIYICHVSLSIPQAEVASAFAKDRSTVRHSCHVVEDWRDDPAYDAFIESLERITCVMFSRFEVCHAD